MAVSRYVICLAELFQQENLKNKKKKGKQNKKPKTNKKIPKQQSEISKNPKWDPVRDSVFHRSSASIFLIVK